MGSAPAAETSGGMGVGPGDIRRYLFIMGSGDFLSCREQRAVYSRHYRSVWLHNGAGILQSVAFLVPPGLDDLDGIARAQGARTVVDQVLPEEDFVSGSAKPGQRAQGFLAGSCGSLIHGRDGATRAGLDHAEGDLADAYKPPAVFGEGFAAPDHQVGTEAVYGQGVLQPGVQVVEGGFGDEQEGEAVGETDPVFCTSISWVY